MSDWGITILLFFSLVIIIPGLLITFCTTMHLLGRTKRLDEAIGRQKEVLRHLSQLCGSLKHQQEESAKLIRQQLSALQKNNVSNADRSESTTKTESPKQASAEVAAKAATDANNVTDASEAVITATSITEPEVGPTVADIAGVNATANTNSAAAADAVAQTIVSDVAAAVADAVVQNDVEKTLATDDSANVTLANVAGDDIAAVASDVAGAAVASDVVTSDVAPAYHDDTIRVTRPELLEVVTGNVTPEVVADASVLPDVHDVSNQDQGDLSAALSAAKQEAMVRQQPAPSHDHSQDHSQDHSPMPAPQVQRSKQGPHEQKSVYGGQKAATQKASAQKVGDTQPDASKTVSPKPASLTPGVKRPAKSGQSQWQVLELFIGQKVMLWVAMGLFLLLSVFVVHYAFEQGWIGNGHKVAGIGVLALLFLSAGKYFAIKGLRRFSTALSSAGISIAFLAGYSMYGYYQLVPIDIAIAIMSGIVVGSFLLSWHYKSRLLGIVSIVGGLAVPLLLKSDVDHYNEFFSYLVVLNIGVIVLINLMKRPPIAMLAFVGTQIEYWLWYRGNYHIDKIQGVLIFQAAFYAGYLIDTTIAPMLPKQRATWDDTVRAILSPLILYGTGWFLIQRGYPEFADQWLGPITFAFAGLYAVLAVVYARHLNRIWSNKANDELSLYWNGAPAAATVISLMFVALAIPLQFDTVAITVGWVTVGAGLWCFGNQLLNRSFVSMSLLFLLLGVVRLFGIDLPYRDSTLIEPILNKYALPILCSGLVMCIAGVISYHVLNSQKASVLEQYRQWRETPIDKRRPCTMLRGFLNDNMLDEWQFKFQFNYVLGYVGLLVTCIIFSIETFEFFRLRPDDFDKPLLQGSLALTALWCTLAVVLLVIGLAFKARTVRIAAVLLFALTAAKVIIGDFPARPIFGNSVEPIWNSCTMVIFAVSVALLSLQLIARYVDEIKLPFGRLCYGALSLLGLIFICAISSIECWYYFVKYPLAVEPVNDETTYFFARASISVLWAAAALVVLVVGMLTKKMPIRIAGLGILAVTGAKVFVGELSNRPDYAMPIANPYFLTIAAPSVIAMIIAAWATRWQPVESSEERKAMAVTGIVGVLFLIASMSFECWHYFVGHPLNIEPVTDTAKLFFARASLPILWTAWAILLFVLGMTLRSLILRSLGMVLLGIATAGIFAGQLFVRPDYETPLINPYFLPIAFSIVTLFLLAIWGTRLQPIGEKEERNLLTVLGLAGLGLAWGALTVECFSYFKIHTELNAEFIAHTSVTVFWTVLAILIALVAKGAKSKVLHYASIVLLAITLIKVVPYELLNRPDDFRSLLNPFMLAMALLSAALMVQAVVSTRLKPAEHAIERHIMFALGLLGLILIWVSLSDECFRFFKLRSTLHTEFVAHSSLTAFWTIFAVVLLLISQATKSTPLRITGIVLLGITLIKAVPLELLRRPDDLAPLLNPFMPTLTLLSLVLIGVGIFTIGRSGNASTVVSTERLVGRVLAFVGLALLFASSSIECHDSVRTQYGDNESAWVAQMAISMLWSVFGGVLIFVGFVWRSPSLRWVAIALFTITTLKVLFNDMAGFDRIYRIGAFFVLAVVMTLVALAYQRFKPENTSPRNEESANTEK